MADPRNQRALRNALGAFATGVTIVTTLDEADSAWGFTANSFTSVSLDPPLVLVCLAHNSGSIETFRGAEHFAVNVLADAQRELSMRFAEGGPGKFAAATWSCETTRSPVFDDVAAWFDCALEQRIEAGDHDIFIGRVLDFGATGAPPLGYCRGAYVPLALDHRLFQATGATTRLRMGAIVEHEMALLLETDPDTGTVSVPMAEHLGDAGQAGSLLARLADWGVDVPALFVFSVFDAGDTHYVVYRGASTVAPPADAQGRFAFHAFDTIPWDAIAEGPVRGMLERYIRERSEDTFGVYVGNARGGILQTLR